MMNLMNEPLNSSDDDDEGGQEGSMWLHNNYDTKEQDEEDNGSNASSNKVIITKGWDKARNLPPDAETQATEDDALYVFTLKALKFLAYVITFLAILVGSVISKIVLVLMTSQLQPKRFTRYCKGKSDNVEVGSTELERIVWSWSISFAFMIPELLVLVRAIRICIFKDVRWPSFKEFTVPFIFETLHMIGLSLLVFIVFPSMDAVSSLILTNGLCLIPGIFAMAIRLNLIKDKRSRKNKLQNLSNILSLKPNPNDPSSQDPTRDWLLTVVDLIAIMFVLTGLVLWPIFKNEPKEYSWLLPLGALLTSFGWWENYMIIYMKKKKVKSDDGDNDEVEDGGEEKQRVSLNPLEWLSTTNFNSESRYVTYLFISIWKCGLIICGMMFGYWYHEFGNVNRLFRLFKDATKSHTYEVTEIRPIVVNNSLPSGSSMFFQNEIQWTATETPIYAMLAQILAGWATYMAAKFACKIGIQKFSFSFPLTLTVPVAIALITTLCSFRTEDECFWKSVFPPYLFWTCPKGNIVDYLWKDYAWVWILWMIAQSWINRHIWVPKFQRLERADILFVAPMYNALFIDQSLTLNRRRDNRITRTQLLNDAPEDGADDDDGNSAVYADGAGSPNTKYKPVSYLELNNDPNSSSTYEFDSIPKIYACATMWHETKEEMMEILKSIFRMDEDQCARRVARKYFDVIDPDYYEFETHVLFDDAFVIDKSKPDWHKRPQYLLNSYVLDLLSVIGKAAMHVHETDEIRLHSPKKFPTPYGGRLEWTLPGKTKLILHLKNKDKIRHKKRWSQVMYMYYLLGYKLLNLDISVARKEVIAENTYLLALDGDIDFQPSAVQLLVDLMKKNHNLGAACGRIHPIGAPSLMVWYQKFEYAIGHWFQKATEHVIGCVLCSPGCFSLFRAKALLDDNVMARYTIEPTEAKHFVQYDQGEDRWLCTLLLQRGYRIEYSAASDSKTHCPEDFGDFFNQRRRWAPSTMANIIDLLGDSKRTIRMNENISYPYILYQTALMIGSILGPGTIFLMLIGAFNTAFRIPNTTAFIWNFVPVFIFILVCFFFDKKVQLIVAQILAAIYALVMVAVIVALMMQIQEDGFMAPSSLFFFGVAASFIIAAMLHPLEMGCLPHGIVYYITIPSMYMILIIYSLMNLHDVSWGTREVIPPPDEVAKPKEEVDKKAAEGAATAGFFGYLPFLKPGGTDKNDTQGSFELSFAGLFKLMCCTKPNNEEKIQLQRIADSMVAVSRRLDSLEHGGRSGSISGERRSSIVSNANSKSTSFAENSHGVPPGMVLESLDEEDENVIDFEAKLEEEKQKEKEKAEPINDDIFPIWAEAPQLKSSPVDFLTLAESTFWLDLIKKYLQPIDKDEKKENEVKAKLLDLRNQMVFFFLMINAVFVLAIFLLQNNKETIFIEWPLGSKYNMTYVQDRPEILLYKDALSLEPIGIVFVFVFAVVIFIQFSAMLVHRLGTFSHIMASTIIAAFCSSTGASSKSIDDVDDALLSKEGLQIIKKMQKVKNLTSTNGGGNKGSKRVSRTDVARRKTIQNLEKTRNDGGVAGGVGRRTFVDLEHVFEEGAKTARTSNEGQARLFGNNNNSRVTFQALERRRTIVENARRNSIIKSPTSPGFPNNRNSTGFNTPGSAASIMKSPFNSSFKQHNAMRGNNNSGFSTTGGGGVGGNPTSTSNPAPRPPPLIITRPPSSSSLAALPGGSSSSPGARNRRNVGFTP